MKKLTQILFLVLISNCLFAQKITGYLMAIDEQDPLFININKSWGKFNFYNLIIDSDTVKFSSDTSGYFEVTLTNDLFKKIISKNNISIKSIGINFLITNFTYSDSLIRLPQIIDCIYTSPIEDIWFSEKTTKKQLKQEYSEVKEFSEDSLYYFTGKYKVGEDKFGQVGNKLYLERRGVWKIFLTKSNILLKKCKYKNDSLNGAYIEYDDKGNKIVIGRLKDGQMKGNWKILNNLTNKYYNVFNENRKLYKVYFVITQ